MTGGRPRDRAQQGFSMAELLVVVAIVAIAAAIGSMLLFTAKRTTGMLESRAVVAATIRRAAAAAARTGVTQGIDLWAIPVASTVRMRTDTPAPLPESAVVLGSIDLQGGTGYPYTNGTNRAVAVVIEDAADSGPTFAVVLGRSATVTEYRLVDGSWEALK